MKELKALVECEVDVELWTTEDGFELAQCFRTDNELILGCCSPHGSSRYGVDEEEAAEDDVCIGYEASRFSHGLAVRRASLR